MFKIAFPWAKLEEEKAEREYLKTREGTSEDEIAGNIWVSPLLGKHAWRSPAPLSKFPLMVHSVGVGQGISDVRLGSRSAGSHGDPSNAKEADHTSSKV